MSAKNAGYELIFNGLSDESDETARSVKSILVVELELPIPTVQQILSMESKVVMTSSKKRELGKALKKLKSAGALVEIVSANAPKVEESNDEPNAEMLEGQEESDEEEEFSFELDFSELAKPQKPKSTKVWELNLGDDSETDSEEENSIQAARKNADDSEINSEDVSKLVEGLMESSSVELKKPSEKKPGEKKLEEIKSVVKDANSKETAELVDSEKLLVEEPVIEDSEPQVLDAPMIEGEPTEPELSINLSEESDQVEDEPNNAVQETESIDDDLSIDMSAGEDVLELKDSLVEEISEEEEVEGDENSEVMSSNVEEDTISTSEESDDLYSLSFDSNDSVEVAEEDDEEVNSEEEFEEDELEEEEFDDDTDLGFSLSDDSEEEFTSNQDESTVEESNESEEVDEDLEFDGFSLEGDEPSEPSKEESDDNSNNKAEALVSEDVDDEDELFLSLDDIGDAEESVSSKITSNSDSDSKEGLEEDTAEETVETRDLGESSAFKKNFNSPSSQEDESEEEELEEEPVLSQQPPPIVRKKKPSKIVDLLLYSVVGVGSIIGGNIFYQNFIASGQKSSINVASLIPPERPVKKNIKAEPTKVPDSIKYLPLGEKVIGSNSASINHKDLNFQAKCDSSIKGMVGCVLSGKGKEPEKLTKRDIVRGKLRDPWVKKIESNKLKFELERGTGLRVARGDIRLSIEYDNQVHRVLASARIEDSPESKSLRIYFTKGSKAMKETGLTVAPTSTSTFLVSGTAIINY